MAVPPCGTRPMRRDRGPSMPVTQGCKVCGWDSPVKPFDPEHDVHHLASRKRMLHMQDRVFSSAEWIEYAHALERLDRWRQDMREVDLKRLNSKIVDLELEVADYKYDVKVLTELVDDLKADLAAALEENKP